MMMKATATVQAEKRREERGKEDGRVKGIPYLKIERKNDDGRWSRNKKNSDIRTFLL